MSCSLSFRVLFSGLWLLIGTGVAAAQVDTTDARAVRRERRDSIQNTKRAYDPRYIRPHKQGLTLQGSAGLEVLQMRFQRPGQPDLHYLPNQFGTIGPGVYYNRFGINVMFRNGANLKDPNVYGQSRFLRLEVPLTFRRWTALAYYQRTRGLYLPNPGQFEVPSRDTALPQPRPDLAVWRLGFNYLRILNPLRYSYSAVFNQSDQQLKTAGSFTFLFNASVQQFGADSALVPRAYRDSFPELNAFRAARMLNLSLSPGYALTIAVAKRFSVAAMLNLGPALQFQSFTARGDTATVVNNRSFGIVTLYGFQFGYNAPRFFIGVWVQGQNTIAKFGEITTTTEAIQSSFYIGYRLPKVRMLRRNAFANRAPVLRGILNPVQGYRVTTTGSHQQTAPRAER